MIAMAIFHERMACKFYNYIRKFMIAKYQGKNEGALMV